MRPRSSLPPPAPYVHEAREERKIKPAKNPETHIAVMIAPSAREFKVYSLAEKAILVSLGWATKNG